MEQKKTGSRQPEGTKPTTGTGAPRGTGKPAGGKKPSNGQKPSTTKKGAKGKKKKNSKKIVMIVIAVLLFLIVAALTTAYCVFQNYYGKANFVSDNEDFTIFETLPPGYEDQGQVDESVAQDLKNQIAEALKGLSRNHSDVANILLIGVDRRDSSWYGNSDAMILISINNKKKTIYMTSFLRDLSADIPGIGVKKLNAACAHGGARLLVQTIENNYGITIDDYAMVDFGAMIHVVDAIGGIDMEVTDNEAEVCNIYIEEMCNIYNEDYYSHCYTGGGNLHLDGYQAVAYARNRYTGNSHDFGRADRQRKVLMAIFNTAKAGGLGSLNNAAQAALPYVTHNMDQGQVLSYIASLPTLLNYSVEQSYIPYEGMYHYEGEMMVPNMKDTINRLHSTIYE